MGKDKNIQGSSHYFGKYHVCLEKRTDKPMWKFFLDRAVVFYEIWMLWKINAIKQDMASSNMGFDTWWKYQFLRYGSIVGGLPDIW